MADISSSFLGIKSPNPFWLASAPPPPAPTVEGAVSTDTTLTWHLAKTADRYMVRWRRTDTNSWQESLAILKTGAIPNTCYDLQTRVPQPGVKTGVRCNAVLKGIRVDDWVFGVSSVSKDGFESPVASAVPGGAFKPWVKPVEAGK